MEVRFSRGDLDTPMGTQEPELLPIPRHPVAQVELPTEIVNAFVWRVHSHTRSITASEQAMHFGEGRVVAISLESHHKVYHLTLETRGENDERLTISRHSRIFEGWVPKSCEKSSTFMRNSAKWACPAMRLALWRAAL